MSNIMKLSFALFLGLVAAGMNWLWVSAKAMPSEFVAANTKIEMGHTIGEEDLIAVPVPGDLDKLKMSLIPYRHRAILFGVKAGRPYDAGDVFFQRDIRPPAEERSWDVIGPFRLISVGARFKEPDQDSQVYSSDNSRNNVTIEVSADFDRKTKQLLEIISPQPSGASNADLGHRIVAVQVVPSLREEQGSARRLPSPNSVYQTVSLDGIPNVPRVLLAGDMIKFVIPAPTVY